MPSPWLNGTSTRWPFLKLWTSLPTSSITPQNSWPITSGIAGTNPIQNQSPDQQCQSERQIPSASERRTTPSDAHSGSGISLTTSGCRTDSITAALMVILLVPFRYRLSLQEVTTPLTGEPRERLFVRAQVGGVDVHGMEIDARFFLGSKTFHRAIHVADVADLIGQLRRNRVGTRLRAAGRPCLLDAIDLATEAEARELLGVEGTHAGRIEGKGAGVRGLGACDIGSDLAVSGGLHGDALRVAARIMDHSAKLRDLVFEPGDGNHHRHPAVSLLRGELDALLVERRDENRDVLAERLEAQREAALELEKLTGIIQRRASHQQVDYVDVLAHPRERRIEFDSVEMLDDVRAARAEPGDHAPAAKLVERGEMLRERSGSARVDINDRSRELRLRRVLGAQREQREGVAAPSLRDPDRMNAGLVGDFDALDQRLVIEFALPVKADCYFHLSAPRGSVVAAFFNGCIDSLSGLAPPRRIVETARKCVVRRLMRGRKRIGILREARGESQSRVLAFLS